MKIIYAKEIWAPSISLTVVDSEYTVQFQAVLRSPNYLFLAPAPTLAIISAPAPAPATAIYWHLKPVLWSRSRTFSAGAGAGEKALDPATGCCCLA